MCNSGGAVAGRRVVCLGDPVLDVLVHIEYDFLERIGAAPGGCFPIEQDTMEALLDKTRRLDKLTRVPGGSAANVAKALAALLPSESHEVAFIGMVGRDDVAGEYRRMLHQQRVQPLLVETESAAPTATCLCMVTPDGNRTMRTSLCAALELQSAALLPGGWADGGAALHCEGYALYRPQLAEQALMLAKQQGMQVSLDLASFETVVNCHATLLRLLRAGLVDIVFCNEEEALALVAAEEAGPGAQGQASGSNGTQGGAGGEASQGGDKGDQLVARAQELLLRHVRVAVTSRGAKGCIARGADGQVGISPACCVEVVDTVGAGDFFTGGFLAACLQGATLQQAAVCGCIAGTAAVQSAGAMLAPQLITRAQRSMAEVLSGRPIVVSAPAAVV